MSTLVEPRFAFGRNWTSFLGVLDDARIRTATASLTAMLDRADLRGLRFLDVGCGSGLFSLAARRRGARVVLFDFDADSVGGAGELPHRFSPDDPPWDIREGPALDEPFLQSLGTFDVVYSWGVLHHTGAMWRALELIRAPLRPGGHLCIAIYNDQGAWSQRWAAIKRRYCSGPFWRAAIVGTFVPYWVARGLVADLVWGRNPLRRYTEYRGGRGMSVWHDWIDWLGGFSFEGAKTERILGFIRGPRLTLSQPSAPGGRP